jgi:myo-inositol 2-dehydrogenase / D-chiro-inositol 1-dehydrogenase
MLKVGVVGTGMIGQDHIRRMTEVLSGVDVVAVSDIDGNTAKEVGERVGATVFADGEQLIANPSVDAVAVCSWGETHDRYVLAAIAAGKPVFCEKPLATAEEPCRRIIEAEVAYGSRLVQVGFMRRYDVAYRSLKQVVDGGDIGAPLMMHCAHRNPAVPGNYRTESAITDVAVHELDLVRWMFDDEIAAVRVLTGRNNRHGGDLRDPLLMILEMAGGALVDVEVAVNAQYGYEVRGEVVGEDGTASLGDMASVTVRSGNRLSLPVAAHWRARFIQTYDAELQDWIDAVAGGGQPVGPSSWDGYAAAVASDAAVEALRTGRRIELTLIEEPKLYMDR